jgi:ABC-2 type transport system ATP-binding protein
MSDEHRPAIEASGLRKSFGDTMVLDGLDLTVAAGTIFALLGPNGAGKTTIINILTTLIKADEGAARVSGFDVATQPAHVRKQISLTGQFAAVDDILTGRENLELIGDLRHVPDSPGTARQLLERFRLTDAADRRVATFSGGMRRRLDIAMSLIGTPSVVFLDEPTTGLDPEARSDMWQTIRTLSGTGTTVFLTTQYLEEADELADQIAILHAGNIAALGTAAELKKRVPGYTVVLTVRTEEAMRRAREALKRMNAVSRAGELTLTVATDGSATRIAEVFTSLRDANVDLADFSQTVPSLDDVFLQIVGEQKVGQ